MVSVIVIAVTRTMILDLNNGQGKAELWGKLYTMPNWAEFSVLSYGVYDYASPACSFTGYLTA